jgi:endo-1,4-beta-mannosidase
MADAGAPFVLGVNYWPRRKAMEWWKRFDRGEVREEFDLIRELRLTKVRIFLLWEDFQPAPDRVSTKALDHLVAVADAADDRGLGLDITFFTGHMSGPNWAPGWLLDREGDKAPGGLRVVSGERVTTSGYRNPYVDPLALAAERLLLREVVGLLVQHPAVWLWNLGNEPDLFALPPSSATGARWVADHTELIRELDATRPITIGTHVPSLESDNGLRVDAVFETCDLSVMHAYPVYATWAVTPTDPELVPFVCALTASLSGRPVLAEEFGACTAPPGQPTQTLEWEVDGVKRRQLMLAEDELATYLDEVLPRLVEIGAIGALPWCFADYDESLWKRPPLDHAWHERYFGLVRPDGSLKPHADVIKRFAATNPTVRPPSARARIGISGSDYYRDPKRTLVELYREFREKER